MSTLAEQLAAYSHALSFETLPDTVVHEVKRRVIDSFACALGAYRGEVGEIVRCVAGAARCDGGATVFGTGNRTTPDLAAFANGAMVRYLDYNDTYLSLEPAHPSDNIPAALAVAEARRRGGRELITAIVLAYEVQCRLCDAASIRARGWDHVTYGAFSTSLAAAKLMGLSPAATLHAASLGGVANVAMRQTRVGQLSHWKGCAFANAARNGVFAALLAEQGMTGPAEIFEGPMGFWNQVSGAFTLPTMGPPFMILNTSIKFFPAEYHSQSAIDAALHLRSAIPDPAAITAITIRSFDAAVDIIGGEAEKWHPTSRETADHSLPYCVAVALVDGEVGLDQFAPERIADPALHALMQKIGVVRDAALTAAYPEGIPNDLEITLRDGSTHRHKVTYPRGHARNPMTDAEVETKFRRLAAPLMDAARIDHALATLWKLETLPKMDEVMGLFAGIQG
jgi:2-methylcitrate dehydratase